MTMLQITFLFIGVFILVLVLATIFKRYQRIILWTAGILMFLGVMFAIGFGFVDVIDDNRPNMPVIMSLILALVCAALLIIGAEKLHKKLREKANVASSNDKITSSANDALLQSADEELVLPERLNSELARKVYAKAIEAGFMAPIISGKNQKSFWRICAVGFTVVIILNDLKWKRKPIGSSGRSSFLTPNWEFFLMFPI